MKKALLSILAVVIFFSVEEGLSLLYEKYNPNAQVDFTGGFTPENPIFVKDETNPQLRITNPQKFNVFLMQKFTQIKNPRTFRIVFLGESSVNFLSNMLPAFSKRLLTLRPKYDQVEILNVGARSYGSTRLAIAANEVLEYQPDLLMIYMGHNEFEEIEQFNLIKPQNSFVSPIYYHSAFFRTLFTYYLRVNLKILQMRYAKYPDIAKSWSHQFTEAEAKQRMLDFNKNLNSIVALYLNNKIPVIIGTIPSNIFSPHLPFDQKENYKKFYNYLALEKFQEAYEFGDKFISELRGRHQSSRLENGIIRDLANSKNLVLADVEKNIILSEPHKIPGETLFLDHCHLNERGKKILLDTFYEAFTRLK